MRNLKFILSAAAILLVGAVAAGLAAHAVVSPRTGEVRSAGVVTIPTVLGQTAEEVLFYPWSMYNTQPLRHLTEEELLINFGLDEFGASMEEVDLFLSEFTVNWLEHTDILQPYRYFSQLMELSFQWAEFFDALECNWDERGQAPSFGTHIYLKDLPATAHLDNETPVTLSFAISNNDSLSLLIRPAQPREITEEEQAAALARVEDDLRLMLLPANPYNSELYWQLQSFYDYYSVIGTTQMDLINSFFEDRMALTARLDSTLDDPYEAPMEEFLSAVEMSSNYWNIQIITTQQQIVALFTENSGGIFGVYYDIQLGCYSGVGISNK